MKLNKLISAALALAICGISGVSPVSTAPWAGEQSVCAAESSRVTKDGMTFEVDDTSAKLLYGDDDLSGDIRIPAAVDGKPVTVIGDSAFSGLKGITSVVIEEGIQVIDPCAFYDCNYLETVTLPSTLTEINESAFEDTGLTEVTVPENVEYIGMTAFKLKYNIANITGRKSLTVTVLNPECELEMMCFAANTIIAGYAGSTAQSFASVYGYKFKVIDETALTTTTTTTPTTTTTTTTAPPETTTTTTKATTTTTKVTTTTTKATTTTTKATTTTTKATTTTTKATTTTTKATTTTTKATTTTTTKATTTTAKPVTTTTTAPVSGGKKGDTNCDGKVELADAILIMQSLANPDKYGEKGSDSKHLKAQGKINGDVDKSTEGLTAGDALKIQEFLLGKISSL
jgi:hypothetical protein